MGLRSVLLVVAVGAVWPQAVESLVSCYSCSGDECVNGVDLGVRIDCNGVQDECYTKFDGYVPTERGCTSALTAANPCSAGSCQSCSSDYCNVLGATQHKCVVCSSVLDETCMSNPSGLVQQCGAPSMDVAETQCYSRVIGSVTERGCVQSQSDLDACDGAQCATCVGEGCNGGEFPEGRQKCVKCSSEACRTSADTSYCDLPDDSCVTAKKTDGTYLKTCEQSMTTADRQFCQSNPSACAFCGQNECNRNEINLAASGRQCYTCQGTDCLRSALTIETCHETDDRCYTIFDGFNPTVRGCRSVLGTQDKAKCDDANDVDCSLCEDDLCNVGGRQDHRCLYCSSALDASCVSPSGQTRVIQCPAPTTELTNEAQCYTRIIGSVTERGCLGSATDADGCDPGVNCGTCAGSGCNTALFPADRRKCVVGSSANQYCPNPWDDCVQIASTSGGANVKKCESSMTAEEVSFCMANSNKCDFCELDNCNQNEVAFNYVECMACNSGDNPACATSPSSITTMASCRTCISLLTSNSQGVQILRRGCLEDLSAEVAAQCTSTGVTCRTCSTNRCNFGNYPANRLECYKCLQPPCISHGTISLEYCPTYSSSDRCVMLLDASGVPVRLGCNSTLTSAEQNTCRSNPQQCRYSSKSRSNDPTALLTAGRCVQCSSAYEPDCMTNPGAFESEPCNDPENSQCFSRLINGNTVERGCLNDLDSSSKTKCLSRNDCALCSTRTDRCNSRQYPPDLIRCHQCDSSQNATCKNAQSGTAPYCSSYNRDNHCSIIVQKDGQTVRKCSTQPHATECAGADRCEICRFSSCNSRVSTAVMSTGASDRTTTTTPKPGGAATVGANLFLTTMIALAVAHRRHLSAAASAV